MRADISAFQGLEALKGRKDPEAIRIAAKEMESLFAYELIKAMREASQESTDGIGKGVYTSLFDIELARLMADRGLGLRDMLLKGLMQEDGQESYEKEKAVKHPDDGLKLSTEDKGSSELPVQEHTGIRLPVKGKISSHFGLRNHPIHGEMRFHNGIDIAASEGTDIYPIRPGKVIFSGQKGGYGNVVIIDHGDGYMTKYAHNRTNLVREGDYVDQKTVIAKVGSTGNSTGPHLHFEVRYGGETINPITLIAMRD